MSSSIQEVDAQRARWCRYRESQSLTLDAGDEFACGGLGRHADRLDLRMLVIPSDPVANAVPLDADVLAWLKAERATPYGGRPPSWGHRHRSTSNALLVYDQYREDAGWVRYVAIHRHGGIEIGVGNLAYEIRDLHVFPLRSIVGLAWIAADLQNEIIAQWLVEGPFELNVEIRNTNGATLGGFAEGWANPGQGLMDVARCIEDHLLLRRESDGTIDAERYALTVGDQLEQAFGTTQRRHLAHQGEYEGRFDPRFQLF